VQVQVSVGGPGADGRREISIHSRPEPMAAGEGFEPGWTEKATGVLNAEAGAPPDPQGAWPPQGAEPLAVDDLYGRLAGSGFEYGPSFQGVTAAWRLGEKIYAEISLSEEHSSAARGFGIHPALFDAAHHPIAFAAAGSAEGGGQELPFAWSDVSLFASGASELRVVLEVGRQGASLQIADAQGRPVASVGSLALREVDFAQLSAQGQARGLLAVEWERVSPAADGEPALLQEPDQDLALGETGPAQATLRQLQRWLAEEREGRLAILTRGAVAVGEGESADPAAAAVRGLVRSAQAEHPGRFALIDTDGSDASAEAIEALLGCESEPELVLREGAALAPRLVRLAPGDGAGSGVALDPERTVLVTGATGGLGSLVSRHLAEAHGARHLLLVSRRGAEADGAEDLRAALNELGAEAEVFACDVSDRAQLRDLLASVPASRPLGAVIHVAGALDDATVEALGPEQIERVFAAKAHGARHLHELTAGMDLSAFVLFSSVAGSLPSPGQGGYAAANAYLDALALRRRAEGLPATSIAWGMWERESAMTSRLGEAGLARLRRAGIVALTDGRGLDLFDQALGSGRGLALALSLDPAALRAQASAGVLPPVFRRLVRAPRRRALGPVQSLASRLAAAGPAEHKALVLSLVADEVAVVLDHRSAADIDPGMAFKEMGFDSLAAVELRNRLNAITGLRLAPAMVFDFPTPLALAEHLLAEATGAAEDGGDQLDQLTEVLGAMSAGDPGRLKVAARLRALAADLEDGSGADSGVLGSEQLEAASDEELMEFIDAQVEADGSPAGLPGGERNGR
jgi:NAD(P)-dependent dehydrogenase (short-subunit alcohol dehydrogenase family)